MDNLESKIKNFKERHKKYCMMYYIGNFLRDNGIRGIWFPYETGMIRAVIHGFLRIVMYFSLVTAFQKYEIALWIYAIIHIALFISGKIMAKIGDSNLLSLQIDVSNEQDEYIKRQYEIFGIVDGKMHCENGITISSGHVTIPLNRDYGVFQIFQLQNFVEWRNYEDLHSSEDKKFIFPSDIISSIAFKEKFGVYTKEANKTTCMAYLSPSMQNNMINHSKHLLNFNNLFFNNGILDANTQHIVNPIDTVNVYQINKKIIAYFQDVDKYCQDMIKMRDNVLNEFSKIEFIKGNT